MTKAEVRLFNAIINLTMELENIHINESDEIEGAGTNDLPDSVKSTLFTYVFTPCWSIFDELFMETIVCVTNWFEKLPDEIKTDSDVPQRTTELICAIGDVHKEIKKHLD